MGQFPPSAGAAHTPTAGSVPTWKKVIYGSGDWSLSSFNTFRQIFYAIFLTDVVGLDPRLASIAAFVGICWDAVNDPIMGTISDRVRTRWGRRRPFLLWAAVPFGLAFILLWWAPPWHSQLALTVYVTTAYVVSDTLQTLVSVPFCALTPEITPDYDERTSLTAWRMFFNLLASLAVALAAPSIVDAVLAAGMTQQQGYLIVAALFGAIGIVPPLLIFATIRERADTPEEANLGIVQTLESAWANVPFRYLTALYMLNWITFDLVGLMIPYFVTYRLAGGDLLAKVSILGVPLADESAMLGLLIIMALVALPHVSSGATITPSPQVGRHESPCAAEPLSQVHTGAPSATWQVPLPEQSTVRHGSPLHAVERSTPRPSAIAALDMSPSTRSRRPPSPRAKRRRPRRRRGRRRSARSRKVPSRLTFVEPSDDGWPDSPALEALDRLERRGLPRRVDRRPPPITDTDLPIDGEGPGPGAERLPGPVGARPGA